MKQLNTFYNYLIYLSTREAVGWFFPLVDGGGHSLVKSGQ